MAYLYGYAGKYRIDVDHGSNQWTRIEVKGKREARKLCRLYGWVAWNF